MNQARASIAIFAAAVLVAGFGSTARAGEMVHRYSFNDGSAKDLVGHADGKPHGHLVFAKGAAQFNGESDQWIELPGLGDEGVNINTFSAVTLEAWFTLSAPVRDWERVFDLGTSNAGIGEPDGLAGQYLQFVPASSWKDARAVMSDAPPPGNRSQAVASGKTCEAGKEIHVAVVVDDKSITLYLNGEKAEQTGLGSRSLDKLSNDLFLLGRSVWGREQFALNGQINEFRIYKSALSSEQVAKSFKGGPDKPAVK